jgi:hypothetical protein
MLRKCWADPADLTAAGSDVGDMRDGPCKDAILSATPARPRCRDNASELDEALNCLVHTTMRACQPDIIIITWVSSKKARIGLANC